MSGDIFGAATVWVGGCTCVSVCVVMCAHGGAGSVSRDRSKGATGNHPAGQDSPSQKPSWSRSSGEPWVRLGLCVQLLKL